MYSQKVHSILADAGWTPDRRISIGDWTSQLESEGFVMSTEAVHVLESFGGLEIRPPNTSNALFSLELLLFEPVLAASGEFDRVEIWQNRLQTVLSPIAEHGEAMLSLGSDGRVFACWGNCCWLDGETFEDAIENTLLIAKRKPILLHR